jgi:hypothetical protein
VIAFAAALSVVLGGSPALAGTKPADTKPADTKPADTKPADTKPDLAHLRALTTKYHDVRAAIADGYVPTDMCVPGMGFHYANRKYAADGVIDPWKPEVVLYVPTAHGPRLAGVEYM